MAVDDLPCVLTQQLILDGCCRCYPGFSGRWSCAPTSDTCHADKKVRARPAGASCTWKSLRGLSTRKVWDWGAGRMKPAHRVGLPNGRRAQWQLGKLAFNIISDSRMDLWSGVLGRRAGECVSELRSGAPAGGEPRRSGSVPGTTGVPCKQVEQCTECSSF